MMSSEKDDAAIGSDSTRNEVTEDHDDEDYEHVDCDQEEEEDNDGEDASSYEYCAEEKEEDDVDVDEVPLVAEGNKVMAKQANDGIPRKIVVEIPTTTTTTTVTDEVAVQVSAQNSNKSCTDHDDDWTLAADDRSNTVATNTSDHHHHHHSTPSISSSFVHQFDQLHTTAAQNDDEDEANHKKPAPDYLVTLNDGKYNISINNYHDKNDDHYGSTPKTPKLQRYYKKDNHNDSDSDSSSISSWNTSMTNSYTYKDYNSSKNKNDDDDESNMNRSTISGFDAISINGTSQLVCRICTLINEPNEIVCAACETPLFNNPCTDSDRILAEQLQHIENNNSYQTLERREMKRKALFSTSPPLQNLLVQSQEFRMDIHDYVQNFKTRYKVNDIHVDAAVAAAAIDEDNESDDIGSATGVGYDVIPATSMDILASRFIETVCRPNVQVLVRYCFTPKLQFNVLCDSICKNGFFKGSIFSKNIHLAYRDQCTQLPGLCFGTENGRLPPIPEGNEHSNLTLNKFGEIPTSGYYIGWIAAMVKEKGATNDHWTYFNVDNVDPKEECTTTVSNPNYTLPLVYFDASMRDTKMIEDLFKGLITVCNDYFELMDQQHQQQQNGIDSHPPTDSTTTTTAPTMMNIDTTTTTTNTISTSMVANKKMKIDHNNTKNDDDEVSLSSTIAATNAMSVQEQVPKPSSK